MIPELLRTNPLCFMVSITTKYPKNVVEELKKIFDVMHILDAENVELVAYQVKNVARTWFDKLKEG